MSIESLRDRRIEDAEHDLEIKVGVSEAIYPGLKTTIDAGRKAVKEEDIGKLWELAFSGVTFGKEIEYLINAINS